jgi:hypothetical protein
MATTYNCPTNAKTCFTFGPAPVGATLAPGRGVLFPPGSGVSSVSFASPPSNAGHGSYPHLPISDNPVRCDGKLVLKVRQFPGMDSSNFTKCFQPGVLKRMRESSKDDSISFISNPPLKGKLSDDQDGPADAVAVRVVEAEPVTVCAAGSSATTPSEADSSSDGE